METIRVRTTRRADLVDITEKVVQVVARSGVTEGAVVIQSLHTTAGITINENADPDVVHDLVAKLERMVPREESFYRHAEGNSDSHLKTSLFAPSATLILHQGKPLLGRWQGIYLCDFDGPRERTVGVQVIGASHA
jgi:secondary thiamine-phosphate synthase enzyme